MKKNSKIILLIVLTVCCLVIIAGVGVYFFLHHSTPTPPDFPVFSGDVVEEKNGLAEKAVVQDVPVKNSTDNKYINCVYPRMASLKDKEFESYINKQIATNINEYVLEIGYIVDDETPATAMYRYVTSYERYNSQKYLSLVVDQDYQTGGIRSNHWKDIYNINVETERIFYLSELFEAGVDYEKAILEEIAKQAEAKNYEMMGGNGLDKLPTKQKFYIKDDKLFIYFDPSEAAATVFGELHFEMPFTMNEQGYFEIEQ